MNPCRSLACTSRALSGFDAPAVAIDVHLLGWLCPRPILSVWRRHQVKQSRDRVRAALQNAQFEFPAQRITVNLAPAYLPNESGRARLSLSARARHRILKVACPVAHVAAADTISAPHIAAAIGHRRRDRP
jgi:predicted ATPase with chaperone activity